jgi:hypothetical protein
MSAIASPLTASQKKDLVKRHTDAIFARKSALGPGQKMKATKLIDALELTMWRAQIDFTAYAPEPKVAVKRYDLDPEALTAEIVDLRAIAADESAPARIRSTAETTAQRLVAQAERRGVEVPAMAM